MRMAELSARSGVAIPTIRYYIRAGLLPSGELTSPNQAVYDESHVRRLALVRAMVEVGRIPIAAVAELFARLAGKDGDEYATLGLVQYALVPDEDAGPGEADEVDELLTALGWRVRPDNPARAQLARALGTLRRLGQDDVLALARRYAAAAHELAEAEVAVVAARGSLDDRAEAVVTTAVLGDAALAALRRLAQEDVVTRALRPVAESRT